MDKNFIKWKFTDEEFLEDCLSRLKKDIESVYPHVKEIIVLSHHLPFYDLIPEIPDPTWAFHRTYLGSNRIGEMLIKYKNKMRMIAVGHSHRNKETIIEGIRIRNLFLPGLAGWTQIKI